jgi:chemotaxis methyl-accepting protein methylase
MLAQKLTCRGGEVSESSPVHLEQVRRTIAERYGFWMNDSWAGQLGLRLAARATATGRASVEEYISKLRGPKADQGEMVSLVESLLIGETCFLRNPPQFSALTDVVLPAWRFKRAPGQALRIVSLGCSTGEEPYSIAMVLAENLTPDELNEVEITGVDVNSRALAAARNGIYEPGQLRELSPVQKQRWFSRTGERYAIHPKLKERVRFFQHNLLHPLPFACLDVVFCCNVLIYFQYPVIASCLREFHSCLRPGGYLFLGHTESALNFPDLFEPVNVPDSVIYRNKPTSRSIS